MGGWRVATSTAVPVQRKAVDAEGEGQQVQVLTFVSNRMRPPQPKRVTERTVDRLGIVATLVQTSEVRVRRRDGPDVLGPVEPAPLVVLVAMQPDRDRPGTEPLGEPVNVVPTELAVLVRVLDRSTQQCLLNTTTRVGLTNPL